MTKTKNMILDRLLKVDKGMLKVLLKAPTETIGGMNVVISRCRGGWGPPYKGYRWGRLNTAAHSDMQAPDLADDLVF